MSDLSRIHDLVHAKLAGRKVDIVGFMREFLSAVQAFAEIRCCLATEQSLRFELGDQTCDVELDAARSKLRMLCARVCVLCKESGGAPISPYGGKGAIASPDTPPNRWTASFKNTPAEQEFTIAHSVPWESRGGLMLGQDNARAPKGGTGDADPRLDTR